MQAQHQGTLKTVQDYYGSVLETNKDLKTNACCTAEAMPAHLKGIVSEIHPEILEKFYGCGSPIPTALEGQVVLDLGCGTGRDCFILSKLVGQSGHVIGVDMTEEQLAVARRHIDFHTERYNYDTANVDFRTGYIEDLATARIEDNSVDVVISNCVINLSPDKERVFTEIFRVLKPGGELFFSDVFADRRIAQHLSDDPVLRGECLGGALYIEDFRRLLIQLGCPDYRVFSSAPLELTNDEVQRKIGNVHFHSMTIRAFNVPLEDRCEDYGQVAYYLGSIEDAPLTYKLDDHHVFTAGKPMLVCGNTASMLTDTRLQPHFRVDGARDVHFGLFDCGTRSAPLFTEDSGNDGGCC